jgi:hypothetical protein
MTLCMAAVCEFKGKNVIALTADSRSQTGDPQQPDSMIGSEDTFKMIHLGKATVMPAGSHTAAVELATACKPTIKEFTEMKIDPDDLDIAVDGLLQRLRQVASLKKIELVKRFVENQVGVSHQDFLKLPTEQYSDVWHSIRSLNLGADILIAYAPHNPVIVKLDRWGHASWIDNYGVIGSGAETARAMLSLQPWNRASLLKERYDHPEKMFYTPFEEVPLEEGLFRLTEAHFAAHKFNPSAVGAAVSYVVLSDRFRGLPNPEYIGEMRKIVNKKHRVPDIPLARKPNELMVTLGSNTSVTAPLEADPDVW